MPKTTNQLIIESMNGKTITETKLSDSGVVSITFKSGEKFSFTINSNQGISYSSVKPKPKADEKIGRLVKAGTKLLDPVTPDKPVRKKSNV